MQAELRHARSGEVSIGYQVTGDGPVDVLVVPGLVSNVDLVWHWPPFSTMYPRLAARSRLIVYDKRGMGRSERVPAPATAEESLADIVAVMDEVGSPRTVLVGISEGSPICLMAAAVHPDRVSGLVLFGGFARWTWAPDYPWGRTEDVIRRTSYALRLLFDGPREEAAEGMRWIGNLSSVDRLQFVDNVRRSADAEFIEKVVVANRNIDVRDSLPLVQAPVLMIHGTDDPQVALEAGRYLAGELAHARLVELPGEKHLPSGKAIDAAMDEVDRFLDEVPAAG